MTVDAQVVKVLTAPARKIDAAFCNGRIYINSLGIGFDGEVLKSIHRIRWVGGHLGYMIAVILKILSFREFFFTIRCGTREWKEQFLLVIINNSSRTGGGFMVTPGALLDDGELDIILCKKLPVWKRFRYLPVIEKGKHLKLPFIIHSHGKEITVESDQSISAQLDGELIESRRFTVSVLPGKYLFRY